MLIQEKSNAIQELETLMEQLSGLLIIQPKNDQEKPVIRTSSTNVIPLVEIIPTATFASLVIEIAMRIEGVVDVVEELSKLAKFKLEDADMMIKQNKAVIKNIIN